MKNAKHQNGNGIESFSKQKNSLSGPAVPAEIKKQLRQILQTVKSVRKGDFSVRISNEESGIIGEIGTVLNEIIDLQENMANEFVRVSKTVGREGKMAERASIGAAKGAW